mmetsp:Transcript_79285/g.230251  ORF Transcript_79285/g.230251 Transcript_79285/m.230251 type:complete len:254 (-) Transcript_79285:277-1038(-)
MRRPTTCGTSCGLSSRRQPLSQTGKDHRRPRPSTHRGVRGARRPCRAAIAADSAPCCRRRCTRSVKTQQGPRRSRWTSTCGTMSGPRPHKSGLQLQRRRSTMRSWRACCPHARRPPATIAAALAAPRSWSAIEWKVAATAEAQMASAAATAAPGSSHAFPGSSGHIEQVAGSVPSSCRQKARWTAWAAAATAAAAADPSAGGSSHCIGVRARVRCGVKGVSAAAAARAAMGAERSAEFARRSTNRHWRATRPA